MVSEKSKAYRKVTTFVEKFHSAYTVVFTISDWKNSTCSCPYFLKNRLWKHLYAIAVAKNLKAVSDQILIACPKKNTATDCSHGRKPG